MMKKKIERKGLLLSCFLAMLCILITGCTSKKVVPGQTDSSNNDTSSQTVSSINDMTNKEIDYYEYGKATKQYYQPAADGDEKLYMKGKNTVILKREADKIAVGYQILHHTERDAAYNWAERFLMRREAAYFEAVQAGFSDPKQEVAQIMEEQIKGFKRSTNKETVDQYLSGLEMTIEQYTETQREQITKELVIAQYWDQQREIYISQHADLDLQEKEDKWQAEKERRYQQLIDAQNYVKVVS